MAANTTPVFGLTPNSVPQPSAAANLASDGSGSLVTIVTAGTNGSRVDQVVFRNAQVTQAASSNMLIKVFLSDAAGANFQLIGELAIAAATRSATVLGANGTISFTPAILMKSGQILSYSQSIYAGVQDRMSATPYGQDF